MNWQPLYQDFLRAFNNLARTHRGMGLVQDVFPPRTLRSLTGDLAIGHTRYSTTGSAVWENSQPVFRHVGANGIALAHNGNLTNTASLASSVGPVAATDAGPIALRIIAAGGR